MSEMVLDTKLLPETLFRIIQTRKVRMRESNGRIEIMPIEEPADCTVGLRGILAGCDDMSVSKFLERSHADKELDL
jgi:hypothetical protein